MAGKDLRLDLVRQYMLDVEAQPASCLEVQAAIDYLRWNFQLILEETFAENDLARRLRRDYAGQDDPAEFMEVKAQVAEIKIGSIAKAVGTKGSLVMWLHRNVFSPILSEENRILEHCDSPLIVSKGAVRGFVDRSANAFRFSAWEMVRFPGAREIPAKTEPCPQETVQKTA